jgi:hypothetical protein
MSITKIVAHYRCDGCNKEDTFELSDRAVKVVNESLDDLVLDYFRVSIVTSIQGEHMLCKECTNYIDDKFPDDELPTYEQVCAALNERAGV